MKYNKAKLDKLVSSIRDTKVVFRDCLLSGEEFLPQYERIRHAIVTLDKILDDNPWITSDHRDTLKSEAQGFHLGHISYISGLSGEAITIAANFLCVHDVLVCQAGKKLVDWPLTDAKLGNPAIGQVFFDGSEYYSVRTAIEHSLKSTCTRWYLEALCIVYYLEHLSDN